MDELYRPQKWPLSYPLDLPYGCIYFNDFEDSGNILDKSGMKYHAEANTGSIQKVVDFGYSRYYDASDDVTRIPDEILANHMGGNWSIECLIKPYNEATNKTILAQYTGSTTRFFALQVRLPSGSNLLRLIMSPDGTSGNQVMTDSAHGVAVDVWNHILVTYQRVSAGACIVNMFINGVLDKTATNQVLFYNTSTQNLEIGSNSFAFGGGQMELKDLGIYNRLFNAAEVEERYNQQCWKVGLRGI